MRVLGKSGSNLVLEALDGAEFVELEHYPPGDVHDPETHSQFYFHAHPPSPTRAPDFGHFHTFLRHGALPAHATPAVLPGNAVARETSAVTTHLVAISMDRYGRPTALFTTNRWVTDETVYPGRRAGSRPLGLRDRRRPPVLAAEPMDYRNDDSLSHRDRRSAAGA